MKRIISKKFNAFSLAEIMIALVIVAILMAASAPLINKKTNLDDNFKCYWENGKKGIFFNDKGKGFVGIGIELTDEQKNNGLHIKSIDKSPQITFYDDGDNNTSSGVLGIYNKKIVIGEAVAGEDNKSELIIGLGKSSDSDSTSENYAPILYGQLASDFNAQKLKVNGRLQVDSSDSGWNTSIDNYDLIVGKKGMLINNKIHMVNSSNETIFEVSSPGKLTVANASALKGNVYFGANANVNIDADWKAKVEHTTGSIYTKGDIQADGNIRAKQKIISETQIESPNIIATQNIIGQTAVISDGYIEAAGVINANGGIDSNTQAIIAYADIKVYSKINKKITITLNNDSGSIVATGNITAANIGTSSDARLKKDIVDYDSGLDIIRKIKVKSFKFKKETEKDNLHIGVIAQEIQKILPNVVNENDEGFLTIRPNDIFFIALNAIKQLDNELQNIKQLLDFDELKLDCSKLSALKIAAKLNKLQNENAHLKNEIKLLEEQNNSLEKRLNLIEKQLKLD